MISTITQRWRDRRAAYRPSGEIIATSDYEVSSLERDSTAKAFVLRHHYAASYPAARFRFGLFRRGELAGVAVFSVPTNPLALRPFPTTVDAVELGRFVLLDDVAANGETWFLARSFELLRRAGVGGVISFSDPMPRTTAAGASIFLGHVGTIYQAHNACFLGRARAGRINLLPDGRVLHNRAMAKVRGKEQGWRYVVDGLVAAGADEPGDRDLRSWLDGWIPKLTRSMRHDGNFKYAWPLERGLRRHLPASLPYPKVTRAQLALPI